MFILCLTLFSLRVQAKSTTVLIYWAVDNDLYEFSLPYLKQFETLVANPNLNLVLEYDYPDHRPTERFHNFKLIEQIGEKDSAHPDTLSNFIQFGVENYPADEFILLIASHASNWSGLIEDSTSESYMSLADFTKTLERSSHLLPKKKFDMIIFDACRMSYVETAFMIGKYTNLILGSAFNVYGFNHQAPLMRHAKKQRSVLETGIDYVEVYPYFPGNSGLPDVGASLLNVSDFLDVLPLSRLFNSLNAKSDTELSFFFNSLYKLKGEPGEDDWGLDLLQFIRLAGEHFSDLQAESFFLTARYTPTVIRSSVTKESYAHRGLGITCAEDLNEYHKFSMSRILPEWAKLCGRMRE